MGIGRMDSRYGDLDGNQGFTKFSSKDLRELETILQKLSHIYPEYLPQYYLIRNINNGQTIFPCYGLIKKIVIDSDGNVYPCDGLVADLCLGNLKDYDLSLINLFQQNSNKVEEIKNIIISKKCQPCFYTCDLIDGIKRDLSWKDLKKIYKSRIKFKLRRIFKA